MRALRAFLIRLLNTIRRTSIEDDLAQELESNLQLQIDENLRAGMSLPEARRQALARSGGIEAAKDAYRDQLRLPFFDTLFQDIRYALRSLRHNPGFALIAIATLALGIGATTAMFGVVRAIILRPLPYRQADRLVRITETNPLKKWTMNIVAPANYADWRKQNSVFTDMAAWFNDGNAFLTGGASPERVHFAAVSGNLFTVLGVEPAMGRGFQERETYEGNDGVVILSHELWKSRFASDPHIIGKTISVTESNRIVVGVMPEGFFFPQREVRLWLPLGLPYKNFIQHRRPHYLNVLGRLKPGLSIDQARAQMTSIATQLEQKYPATNTKMGVRLDPYHDAMFLKEKRPLLVLMSAVGLLFLIVCSNLANLLLGRASARTREFAIRGALGAGKARLARQLLTESLALSIPGGVLGVAMAAGLHTLLVRLMPTAIPSFAEIRIDSGVMYFAGAVTLLAPMVFGLAPALTSARVDRLRDRSGYGSRAASLFRGALVAAEVGLSVVLVAGAALLVQSLQKLERIELGFRPEQALTFNVQLPYVRYGDKGSVKAVAQIEQQLQSQAGVEVVGASQALPLKGSAGTGDATPEGRPAGDYERELRTASVTASYFKAAGIPVLSGRAFNQYDTAESEQITVVNQALEKVYFRGQPAVGKRLKFGRPTDDRPFIRIVGVVADTRQEGLNEPAPPMAFKVLPQQPANAMYFVARGSAVNANVIRRAVSTVDPTLAVNDIAPLREVVDASLASQRFRTSLLTSFAGIALFLAALGIYGVLAWSVTQRVKEIGVRLALGASHSRLFAAVVSQGMYPVVAGAFLGLAGALATTRYLQTLLFEVAPTDIRSYLLTCAILVGVALAACIMPAVRAVRVDPVVALREQ